MVTWKITKLICYPSFDGKADVVSQAYWVCSASRNGITATRESACALPPPGASFVPYNSLTANAVLQWVWANGVNKIDVEAAVAQDLESRINPPVVAKTLPWS